MSAYWPGTRLLVFDSRLYVDDVKTPPSVTVKPATVIRWYGRYARSPVTGGPYPSLVDVEFDHRPGEESRGHFANPTYVEVIA